MAAEAIAAAGVTVQVFDAMPSAGRKFLLAGRGGLNLTHSEPIGPFLSRYGKAGERIAPLLQAFGPDALREWTHELGIDTFVGSSGRVFPKEMKAAPLLRAWLHRLRAAGVRLRMRHRWTGWDEAGRLRFESPQGLLALRARAVVLALGGASWARLGSDGAWVGPLQGRGVPVARLQPANCGFDLGTLACRSEPGWSAQFVGRFAGQPLKTVAAAVDVDPAPAETDAARDGDPRNDDAQARDVPWRIGDFVITDTGIEGTLVYALSAELRDAIAARGGVTLRVDLTPGRSRERLATDLAKPRGGRSFANHLRARAGIEGAKAGLLREALGTDGLAAAAQDPSRLADAIKSLPLPLARPRPIDEAISTSGGVRFEALDDALMLRGLPGFFCAGEMLDWEAPTGGYLLTACFASGRVAGAGAARFAMERRDP
ncbi:TIGR03862 family flavoprotein [Zeimonas arvi]|uniref:TIGR03862 family flavoprotein n=2 Tax=Zeimonas arvi TaxID=2498847 RepID=A0A5C8P6I5_9BURK|nr:TIGR03862 family flavoprotein [Zeimonas arvi]